MKDLDKEGAGLIKAWQPHLRGSKTPQPNIKEIPKPVEAPRQYNVLLVGSRTCYAMTLRQVLLAQHPNINFTGADNVEQAKELLVQSYHANQGYDLVVIAEGVGHPSYIGVVTDQLRQRSMCGDVFVFNPVDDLQARKLGMTPVNNIEGLIYHIRPKQDVNNIRGAPAKESEKQPTTHEQPSSIEGILAALQTQIIIRS